MILIIVVAGTIKQYKLRTAGDDQLKVLEDTRTTCPKWISRRDSKGREHIEQIKQAICV
jgi:hypothetical protein